MKDYRRNIVLIISIVVITALCSVMSEKLYFSSLEWKYRTALMEKKLTGREILASTLIRNTILEIEKNGGPDQLFKSNIVETAGKNDIILLIYDENRISFWSGNNIDFPGQLNEEFKTHKLLFISNGWFLPLHEKYLDYDIVALICTYREYSIKNDLLKSGFPEGYRLPEGTAITFDTTLSPFTIKGVENEFHFGLLFPDPKPNTGFVVIPLFFWLLLLIVVLRLVNILSVILSEKLGGRSAVIFCILVFSLIYLAILVAGIPASVNSTEIFSHFIYSAGMFLPSLGHIGIVTVFIVSGLYIITGISKVDILPVDSPKRKLFLPLLLIWLAFITFLMTAVIFRSIVTKSTIEFEAYKILNITPLSLAGFLFVVSLLSVPIILFVRSFRILKNFTPQKLLVIILAVFLLALPFFFLAESSVTDVVFVLAVALIVLVWVRSVFSLSSLVAVYSAVTAVYSTVVISKYSEIRENENLKVLAVTLANDNDLIAESMFLDLWPELDNDTVLKKMMRKEIFTQSDINNIDRYLQSTYFNGYWSNYDMNILICHDDSPLRIPAQSSFASNCFIFFEERTRNIGEQITGTGFWFMHNLAGRPYYLAKLFYESSPFLTNGLFIELVGHIDTYQAGYPELLLDEKYERFPRLKDISYAKYANNTLVLRSGDYPYDNQMLPVSFSGEGYQIITEKGFKHLCYDKGDIILVITKQTSTKLDLIITFAYLFITILICSLLLLIILTRNKLEFLKLDTFRRRLQFAFATMLAIIFVLVIIVALSLSINKFKSNHINLLREKATSLSIELDHKFASESTLYGWKSDEYYSLDELLVRFSNVFLSDINLYDPEGYLMATSRPEMFSEDLEGVMIDPSAYSAMKMDGKLEYIGEERIGYLEYLSIYIPFYNTDNELLAYMNLPYFRMQNILTAEISNLVITLINFSLLLLMLMMWLSVFLSDRITSPLRLIQQAMASVEYGRKNEYIHYSSRDEVGELVKQYNRMVDELDDSALKLARSEREMAWREMARQIAHEIKNPLTPMKLNVQQLLKWWKDETPDFSTRIEKFTSNQIEYIDNLSSIASAFSYFARLPGAEPTEVDVLAQLGASLQMFGQTDVANISLNSGNISKAMVMADKEHLNGIFSNLLKNAIQAIPSGKTGEIEILLSASFDKLLIVFKDNGVGVPEELKPKLFTPNFTTKSSGMGLGLSIVKRYVETAGGKIWFESAPGKGTSFFIELPLLFTVERLNNDEKEKTH